MLADEVLFRDVAAAQKCEITEHIIYQRLSRCTRDPNNKDVLRRISSDELRHHDFWKQFTGHEERPARFKVWYTISPRGYSG